ncbi:hypothetical protein IGJ34_001318 [Enterococcus sp. AZ177]
MELKRLFDYLNSKEGSYISDYDKTLMRFMIYSGVRISEALVLNWNDIDFQNNIVNIDKTLSQTKHGYIISDPKTNSSSAKLTLDDTTIKTLKKWQINQRKYMLTIGITDPKLIFCGIYNQVVSHHSIYKRLQTITEKCGIPFLGVHITRHTHASLLLESGASMKEVQERLRHASIKMTMDTYSHLSQESKKKQLKNW